MNSQKPFQQNQIKRTLSESSGIAYIRTLLKGKDIRSRSELAERVCKHFEFYDDG